MLKNVLAAAIFGSTIFALSVIGQAIFGVHVFHLTSYPLAEAGAFYISMGVFCGLQWTNPNRLQGNLFRTVAYGVIVFGTTILMDAIFGTHDLHLTYYPVAEDAAVYCSSGLFFGLWWGELNKRKAPAK